MKNKTKIINALFVVGALIPFIYCFYYCAIFELRHALNYDVPMYWAIGRGMLNRLRPYSDLYENKPLGIFILSAISFLLTNDSLLCNIFSLISLTFIAIVPTLIVLTKLRKEPLTFKLLIPLIISLLFGTLFMVYSEAHACGFQVEPIGAAFSMLYILSVVKMQNTENKHQLIVRTIITAILIQLSVMMKEPFLLTAVTGAIFFIDSIKDFVKCIIIPGIIGGIGYLITLACFGVFKSYFTIYFSYMFDETGIGDYTALSRTKNILNIVEKISRYSVAFLIILGISILITLLGTYYYKKNSVKVFHILRIVISILIISFTIGLGRNYFKHHYVFAIPVYCSYSVITSLTLYYFLKNKKITAIAVSSPFIVFLFILTFMLGTSNYDGDFTERYLTLKRDAEFVDKLLDFYGEDRYQYVGFNGDNRFYGFTKHSPLGPIFVQDSLNFYKTDNWFSREFLNQLNNTNIIIFETYNTPSINDKVAEILANDFTQESPKQFDEKPDNFMYKIYYRNDWITSK